MKEQQDEWANHPTEKNDLIRDMKEMVEKQSSIINRLLEIEKQSQVIVGSSKEQTQIIVETSKEQIQAIKNLSEILKSQKDNSQNNIGNDRLTNIPDVEKDVSKELAPQTAKSTIMIYPTWYMVLYLIAFIVLVIWMIVRYL